MVKEETEMFVLLVWDGSKWRWGINRYSTYSEAQARVKRLKEVGIRATAHTVAEMERKVMER